MDEERRVQQTGPKSDEGKAMLRLNPVKHGIYSQTPVLPLVEDAEQWERLKNGVFEHFAIEGAFEESMGLLIAGYIWRSHRVVRLETESVTGRLRNVPRDWAMSRSWQGLGVPEKVTPEVIEEMDRLVAARLLPNDETLAKVMRYGTGLHRQLMDTIQQLIVIRALRPAWEGKTLEAPTPAVEVRRAGKRVVIRVKGAGSDRQGRSRGG